MNPEVEARIERIIARIRLQIDDLRGRTHRAIDDFVARGPQMTAVERAAVQQQIEEMQRGLATFHRLLERYESYRGPMSNLMEQMENMGI